MPPLSPGCSSSAGAVSSSAPSCGPIFSQLAPSAVSTRFTSRPSRVTPSISTWPNSSGHTATPTLALLMPANSSSSPAMRASVRPRLTPSDGQNCQARSPGISRSRLAWVMACSRICGLKSFGSITWVTTNTVAASRTTRAAMTMRKILIARAIEQLSLRPGPRAGIIAIECTQPNVKTVAGIDG